MTSHELTVFFLQLAVMLGAALVGGHLMRSLRQPAIVGEVLFGLVIGPTVFGALAPDGYTWLFDSSGPAATARNAAVLLGMLFFLFIAGTEVDLTDLSEGRRALIVGAVGTAVPLAVGVAVVYLAPGYWAGPQSTAATAVFLGINLANSANPVLARILADLGLLGSRVGRLAMTATVVDDLVSWLLFAVLVTGLDPTGGVDRSTGAVAGSVALAAAAVLGFFLAVLVLGRPAGRALLRWARPRLPYPSGLVGVIAVLILAAAAGSEAVGIHPFLGAFLVGAALAGHDDDHTDAHQVLARFALSFFAPIYFVSIGMQVDVLEAFDPGLVAVVTALALASKLAGVLLGTRLAGIDDRPSAMALAWGLNARGATGIILAGIGREVGLVGDELFVALMVMSLLTTLVAGPMMQRAGARAAADTSTAPPSGTGPAPDDTPAF